MWRFSVTLMGLVSISTLAHCLLRNDLWKTSFVIILIRLGTQKLAMSCRRLVNYFHTLEPSFSAWGLQVGAREGQLHIRDFCPWSQQQELKSVPSDTLLAWRVVVLSLFIYIITLLPASHFYVLWQHLAQIGFKWHPLNTCWIELIHKVWVWGRGGVYKCIRTHTHMLNFHIGTLFYGKEVMEK